MYYYRSADLDFLGVWEQLNNPDFKTPEFGGFKMEAGSILSGPI